MIEIHPIGWVRGGRPIATKDSWGENLCQIHLDTQRFGPESLQGLGEVSHIEILFHFHLHTDEPTETAARHPRNMTNWPAVGIFAQRGRMRPNRIGASICGLLSVEGTEITVKGLDAVDGSPVLDIKPLWSGYLPRGDLREPVWARELMAHYW